MKCNVFLWFTVYIHFYCFDTIDVTITLMLYNKRTATKVCEVIVLISECSLILAMFALQTLISGLTRPLKLVHLDSAKLLAGDH